MKKSIPTLIAFIAIVLFSFSSQAQTKPADEKPAAAVDQTKPAPENYPGSLNAEEKEGILNILSAARATLLKSANSNTTEQNVNLINELQKVMSLLNERFQKPVAPEVKSPPKK